MSVAIPASASRERHRHGSRAVAHDSFDRALGWGTELSLAAVLTLSPLAFGSVEQWAQGWMLLGVGVAAACLLTRTLAYARPASMAFTWAYVPMLAFVLLAVLQLTALPPGVVAAASPKAASAWQAAQQLNPGETIRQTLSMYPLGTERQLRLLVLVCGVFVIVLAHFRDRERIVRLLWAMVLSGTIVGLIAVSQHFADGKSMWAGVEISHPFSGPFMNHSAFGQFMNLATGAALALLLIGLKRQIGDRPMSFRSIKHHLFRKNSAALLLPLLFVVFAPLLVALSLTRGGVLSIAIAGAVAGLLLAFSHSGRGKRTLLAVIGFLVLLAMLKFGFDRIYDRMATLRDLHETGGGVRLQMVRDMMPIVGDFPIFGIGLGAFPHVFPGYDSAAIASYATHAENEYAQLLVEAGVVGAALIALFLGIVIYNAQSAARLGKRSVHAGAVGLVFGLAAILVHSASDFGQHVPAIACMTAVVTALLIRLGIDARADRQAAPAAPSSPRGTRVIAIAGWVVLTAGLGWAGTRTFHDSRAEADWLLAKRDFIELQRRGLDEASEGEFIQTLRGMTRSAELMPGDADYRYGLNALRWQSIRRYDRELTAEFLQRISDESLDVLAVAPYFGPAMILSGQIRAFELGDESAIALLRKGHNLARYSAESTVAVAMLDAREGDYDACMNHLRRAIELGASRASVATMLVRNFDRVDLATQLVEGSRGDMIALAQTLEASGNRDAAAKLYDAATMLLITEASSPEASPEALVQLAQAYRRENHHADAVPLLRRALAAAYDRGDWRVMLIESLAAGGDLEEAVREAKTHYRQNPGDPAAKRLLEDLVTAPSARRLSNG